MSLVERLKKVEDECKLKEDERVSLELEMTEVKESLKKALNGGVTLGLTIEPKSGTSSPQVRPRSRLFYESLFTSVPYRSPDLNTKEQAMRRQKPSG